VDYAVQIASDEHNRLPSNVIIVCVATFPITPAATLRRIQRLQAVTIAWMTFEAAFSLWAAWRARSPALLAFGGDSAIELLSAAVVLWRFRSRSSEHAERTAARTTGALLILLAVYVILASVLSLRGYVEPKSSYLGIGVLVAAALVMPWLARQKRRLSAETGSAALRADATESALCAYLSIIALAGITLHAVWQLQWADPVAALAITPLVLYEARETLRGKPCGCC
jgi:divalent metal cation (Fe/Co/Zn/Cd) transporter